MDDHERLRLRELQDRWLALLVIQNHIRNHGEHERIGWVDSPTFDEVKRLVMPEYEQWFKDFFT